MRRIGWLRVIANGIGVALALFFLLPLLWYVFAPFNERATLSVSIPETVSLRNFEAVFANETAIRSLFQNSLIISGGVMILTAVIATLAAYGFSRGDLPGRNVVTYVLILFSSVVTGTASLVPIFVLIFNLGLFNTYQGVILTIVGGLLPTSIFIMRDFIDGLPRSYEEAAMVSGASSLQIFRDIVFPTLRPGILVVAVLAFVAGWGAFLTPLILIRTASMRPGSIAFYQFYSDEGTPNIPVLAAYAVIYTLPVLLLYLLINARYGFRFFGGIKQ
ncbi:MAG: carbohydrate ABC transporter permease [bacterium]|nr:carbohydrate ABC transporter permease [bacterium]